MSLIYRTKTEGELKMGIIYKIQNKQNNKIYIGKTVNSIEERWQEHVDEALRGSSTLLHKSIVKYGVNNFFVDIVEECSNDILNEREKYYIQLFHSYMSEGGYNMTFGGEGAIKYSDQEILALWNQGLLASEIAKTLGAKPNTISQRLKSLVEEGEVRRRYSKQKSKSVI